MAVSIMRREGDAHAAVRPDDGCARLLAFPLAGAHAAEALAFLAARPVHTVYLAGLIRDNGVESALNRGTFYGCRDAAGRLEGVALIGHATLLEARTARALEAFARLARTRRGSSHLIRIEQESVGQFWRHYDGDADGDSRPPLVCREVLYELRLPTAVREPVAGLRRATLADLSEVLAVNASMAVEECGVNPLERDPLGYRVRTARRIELGRVWVWENQGRLVFKADALSETPGAVYLEGVHVHPQDRGKGHGLRCMSQLGRTLLRDTDAVCLVANEKSEAACKFYRKAGYRFVGRYDTIYLQPRGGN